MTRYYTNFEDSEIGSSTPLGWTRRWKAAENPETPSPISPVYVDLPVKKRGLLFDTPGFTPASFDAVGSVQDFEVLTLVKRYETGSPTTGADNFVIWGRASGAFATRSELGAQLRWDTQVIWFRKESLGGGSVEIASTSFVLDPLTAYWVRWSCVDLPGSPSLVELKMKVWAEGTEEPSAWSLTAYDADFFGVSGWLGPEWFFSPQKGYINFFSVGTDGDTAWKPLTNDEFSAWLDDQSVIRRSIMEMDCVGYDPAGNFGTGGAYLSVPAGSPAPATPAETPDSSAISITGDMEIQIKVRLDLGFKRRSLLCSKWTGTGNQRSWVLSTDQLNGKPTVSFSWSTDGTLGASRSITGYIDKAFRDGDGAGRYVTLKVTLDVDDGAGYYIAKLYYSTNNGKDWVLSKTSRDSLSPVPTVVFDSTAPIRLGYREDPSVALIGIDGAARIKLFRLFDGIDGTLVSEFDSSQMAAGDTSHTSWNTGEVWTINSPSTIDDVTGATRRRVYLADGGFTSQAWDSPASQHYDAWAISVPTLKRELNTALSGRAEVGFGSLEVMNGASSVGGEGPREDWLRMKWLKNYYRQWIGDPSWPKHDFRELIVGRLEQPVASARNRIRFDIFDLLDLLRQPLQLNRFTENETFALQRRPYLAGHIVRLEPTPTGNGLTYHVHDGEFSPLSGAEYVPAYDGDDALFGSVSAPSATYAAATNQISQTAHGLQTDSRIKFSVAPTGLSTSIWYWVLRDDANTYRVSVLQGGSAADITADGSNVAYEYTLYWEDGEAGEITLVSNPASRLILLGLQTKSAVEDTRPASVMSAMIFEKLGLSANFKDSESFDSLYAALTSAAGIGFLDEAITALDALHRFAVGVNCWYGFTGDGRLQVGRMGLPEATAVMSFEERDVRDLTHEGSILPLDRENFSIQYAQAFYRNGALQLPSTSLAALRMMYDTALGDLWDDPSTPLDSSPSLSEMNPAGAFASFFSDSSGASDEVGRIQTLFARKLGRFRFRTRIKAMELSPGQTISLSHSRLGWKLYSASNPTSPENSESFDARLAVVLGTEFNPNGGPLPVTVRCLRQIPGYYSDSDLN